MQPQRIRGRVVVVQRAPRTWAACVLWGAAEVVVTLGVVVLLLVVHQLWWTNHQARLGAERQVRILEEEWGDDSGDSAGPPTEGAPADAAEGADSGEGATAPSAAPAATRPPRPASLSSAYAVLRIPALSLSVPVAPGVSKRGVLDKGYVGHYPRTGRPGQVGNFALAGHRNTHGEPFRYVNRLRRGDEIRVRTRTREYVYVVDQVLARTSPRDTGVIAPVPRSLVHPSAGYDTAGSYLTLTTCTPEFSSTHRLIVWAKLRT